MDAFDLAHRGDVYSSLRSLVLLGEFSRPGGLTDLGPGVDRASFDAFAKQWMKVTG